MYKITITLATSLLLGLATPAAVADSPQPSPTMGSEYVASSKDWMKDSMKNNVEWAKQ